MSETKVTWGLGVTLNLGDFNSLRIDHSISDEIRAGETLDQANERIYNKVEQELITRVKEAKENLG